MPCSVLRQRHAVGGVDGAEAARDLFGHLGAHRVENRQGQRRSAQALKERAAVDLQRGHGELVSIDGDCDVSRLLSNSDYVRRLLFQEHLAVHDVPDHVLHPVAVGLQSYRLASRIQFVVGQVRPVA